MNKDMFKNNKNFSKEQNDFIDKWLGYRTFIDNKEKYKNKIEIEVKKYNINKMVA